MSNERERKRVVAFGIAMASRRKTLGLSQRNLADELNLAQKAVWEWEAGRVSPTVESIWKIADALNTTPSELFAIAEEVDVAESE